MKKQLILLMLLLGTTGCSAVNSRIHARTMYSSKDYSHGKDFPAPNSTLNIRLHGRFNMGKHSEEGGLAEIIVYNPKHEMAYAASGLTGEVIKISIANDSYEGIGYHITDLIDHLDDFDHGDLTGIAINSTFTKVAVAIQDLEYTREGRILVLDIDEKTGEFKGRYYEYITGIQPDYVTFTPDGTKILVANEAEPRLGDGNHDPNGSVSIINVKTKETKNISFKNVHYDQNVLLQKGKSPQEDFEPENIACTNDMAYITLQENNAIAVLDLNKEEYIGVYGMGLKDHSKIPLDLVDDGEINIRPYTNLYSVYMPDGIALLEQNGNTYILTANEGDERDWGEGGANYVNTQTSDTSPSGGIRLDGKTTWMKPKEYPMLNQEVAYIFGGRSFSIFQVHPDGLELIYDSGSEFEEIIAKVLPDYFNVSNDEVGMDQCSGKKGPEPEGITIGQVGEKIYAFIGLERVGGIMVYDITDPTKPQFSNYFNSRNYTDDIAGDVSPEGLQFVPKAHSPFGKDMLIVANEGSGTVAVLELEQKY